MQTGKCAKVTRAASCPTKGCEGRYDETFAGEDARAVALGQILISYFHILNTDERSPTEFPLCQ